MTSKLTREQLEEWVAQFDEDGGCDATDRQLEALIRQSLAAMDSEPVANAQLPISRGRLERYAATGSRHGYSPSDLQALAAFALSVIDAGPVGWTDEQELRDVEKDGCGYLFTANPITQHADPRRVVKLYRHAQPAPAIDSEPVAYMYHGEDGIEYNGHNEFSCGGNGVPLYRHAQPGPVVDREPVAWRYRTTDINGNPNPRWSFSEDASLRGLYQPLYTAPPAPVVPDEMLCEFYEVDNWPDLVRELVKHVEQLQDSAKRNVKPWEDTFPETLLPAYIDRIKQADEACRAAMLNGGK